MAVDPDPEKRKLKLSLENSSPFENGSCSFLGFGSDFNSPVESEFGSTEIESDKDNDNDDYTAELSRRMAQYMLQDDDNNTNQATSRKQSMSWSLSGSPISTLWSPLGSSQGSPEGPSKEPSPPTTPVVAENGGFDISYNFFNQLEKINGLDSATVSETPKSILTGLDSSRDQVRVPKSQRRKQRGSAFDMQGKQVQGFTSNASQSPPQVNSVMKAGLAIGSGSKNGLPGTGVFLPRHLNNGRRTPTPVANPQPQKKKGPPTVLIPVKVLQALQLHHERMNAESRPKVIGFPLHQQEAEAEAKTGNGVKKSYLTAAKTAATTQTDLGLPQEWTY